jgi:protocatechuate 3,4-dioxygenase beta subunit
MRKTSTALLIVCLGVSALAAEERIVGGPCEGCEAVFQGRPAALSSTARIAPKDEAGEPMILSGKVTRPDGAAAPGVIVYAYQTNAAGIYPTDERVRGQAAHRHGRLRAFAVTDASGAYRFETIRPAGYPGTDLPQHIHMHVVEPGRCTYWIDDVVFEDDPRLTPRQRTAHRHGRGGSGIVRPARSSGGAWEVRRDIALGAGIRDYEACGAR